MAKREFNTKIENSTIYPSDSDHDGQNRKKVAKVVTKDQIMIRKKSFGSKIKDLFITPDQDIKGYIVKDVIVPTIKNTIIDLLESLFFNRGGSSRRSRSRYEGYSPFDSISYGAFYRSEGKKRDRQIGGPRYDNTRIDYRNIVVTHLADAEAIVNILHGLIGEYGSATVEDLLDTIDQPTNSVDRDWGWSNMGDIRITPVSGGYLIDVREVKYLG